MTIVEIGPETLEVLERLRLHKKYGQHDIEYLVNRAVVKYANSRMGVLNHRTHKNPQVRKRLSNQNWLCAFCHIPITMQEATIDHLRPRLEGHNSLLTPENFVIVHDYCNNLKGNMSLESWVEFQKAVGLRPVELSPTAPFTAQTDKVL